VLLALCSVTRSRAAPAAGLFFALGLVALAMGLPAVTDWHPHVNHFAPLHADWDPRVGPGTVPAVLLAVLVVWFAGMQAQRLRWRPLLLASYGAGLAWMLSLAFVDGRGGIATILESRYEYLPSAHTMRDFPAALREWVGRIRFDGLPADAPHGNWPVHVAGHPPGALGFFVVLDRVGLGSGFQAGLVVTLLAASTAVAVLVTVRLLGAEVAARTAAPFLVFGPAAVWQCVSADGMFAAVAAWGIAALTAGAVHRSIGWSLVAGLLLGSAVMLSYGLPLLGLLAIAVLVVARSWWPLPFAVVAASAVVAAFGWFGFWWWQALPALHDRYWEGVARLRPGWYWAWGDLAALTLSAGPAMWVGLASLGHRPRALTGDAARVVRWLVVAAVGMVAVADASQMSKAEVERIWLPFAPWLLLACALLPESWRRPMLALQVVVAIAVQHLLQTGW
jgi:methylthioxylose transferase